MPNEGFRSVNPLYRELSGRALGMPADTLGPTGKVFVVPGGGHYSTHLGVRDDTKGYPLLVPNQVEVDALLYGRKPTPEQYERAKAFADAHPDAPGVYDLPKGMDAQQLDAWEATRHDDLERRGFRSVKPFLR